MHSICSNLGSAPFAASSNGLLLPNVAAQNYSSSVTIDLHHPAHWPLLKPVNGARMSLPAWTSELVAQSVYSPKPVLALVRLPHSVLPGLPAH